MHQHNEHATNFTAKGMRFAQRVRKETKCT